MFHRVVCTQQKYMHSLDNHNHCSADCCVMPRHCQHIVWHAVTVDSPMGIFAITSKTPACDRRVHPHNNLGMRVAVALCV